MAPVNPGPNRSWASQDDYAGFNMIVILVGICFFSYMLWINHHAQISAFVMLVMHREIAFISYFSDRYRIADQQMAQSDPSGVTLKDLYGITQAVGMFFRIPATALIVVLAAICTVRAAPARFKRHFDLDGLIKEQAKSFPAISAFVNRRLNLAAPSVDKILPADYALTPAEWIARFATDPSGRFNEQKAQSALAAQLADRWTDPAHASPAARLLFTVFALHLAERREDALNILGEASACLADAKEEGDRGPMEPLKLDPALIERLDGYLKKSLGERATEAALAISDRHAYTATALMGLLNAARIKSGVLAPAQFGWLKLVDRNLWYALYSLGYEIEGTGRYIHPNPRVEALGARNHWAAERVARRPILKPHLTEALATLQRFSDMPEANIDA
jgi:intracellular multiplication protein IcmP